MRKSRKVGCTKDAFLITERRVNEFHHAYISGHCQKLLYDLFELKQGNVPFCMGNFKFNRCNASTALFGIKELYIIT